MARHLVESMNGMAIATQTVKDGMPVVVLMPRDYCATDHEDYELKELDIFRLVEHYAEIVETKREQRIKADEVFTIKDWRD